MKVTLRNPDREVEVLGGRKVNAILGELGGIDPDTVLVIRERELLTREDRCAEADRIEIRPVISGGSDAERLGELPAGRELAGQLSDEVMPAELYGVASP